MKMGPRGSRHLTMEVGSEEIILRDEFTERDAVRRNLATERDAIGTESGRGEGTAR